MIKIHTIPQHSTKSPLTLKDWTRKPKNQWKWGRCNVLRVILPDTIAKLHTLNSDSERGTVTGQDQDIKDAANDENYEPHANTEPGTNEEENIDLSKTGTPHNNISKNSVTTNTEPNQNNNGHVGGDNTRNRKDKNGNDSVVDNIYIAGEGSFAIETAEERPRNPDILG